MTKLFLTSIDEFYRQDLSFPCSALADKCLFSTSALSLSRHGKMRLGANLSLARSCNVIKYGFEKCDSVAGSAIFSSLSHHSVFKVNDFVQSSLALAKYSAESIWSAKVDLYVDDIVYNFLHIIDGENAYLMARRDNGYVLCYLDTTTDRTLSDWCAILQQGLSSQKHLRLLG